VRTPADLKRYPLLRSSDESWTCGSIPEPKPTGTSAAAPSTDSLTVLAAAEQGQGLALTRWNARGAGSRQRPRRARERAGSALPASLLFCLPPESYLALPKLQHLLEWLREMARPFQGPTTQRP